MPSVYFISDLHFGHEKICDFRDGFGSTSEEHDDILISKINSTVRAKDKLFVLGDAAFGIEGVKKLGLINCKNMELIIGNHDSKHCYPYFNAIHGFRRYKEFWLSHCPVHPEELRGKVNIHGHVHNKTIEDSNYISVCVEACDGIPMTIDQIRAKV